MMMTDEIRDSVQAMADRDAARPAEAPASHAEQNAAAWLDHIVRAWVDYRDAYEVGNWDQAEDQVTWAMEAALEVTVRDDWRDPHASSNLAEFRILLTYGGPACRLYGEISEYGIGNIDQVLRLEFQDWGTQWISYPLEPLTQLQRDALSWFAGCYLPA